MHRFRHVTDVLLEAGYACAWARYRTEVELGYQTGGRLRTGGRQGMELMNRAPLEYEDEVAVLRDVASHPQVDADRLFHLGVSHAGEMLFKLLSQYDGLLRAGVAAEPASHELLTLGLDGEPTVENLDGLRDIESLEIRSTEHARARITDRDEVSARLDGVDIPVLVLGRDQDELQGIFRLTYELLAEKRDDAEWRSWSHDVHGYIFPESDEQGVAQVDDVQREALGDDRRVLRQAPLARAYFSTPPRSAARSGRLAARLHGGAAWSHREPIMRKYAALIACALVALTGCSVSVGTDSDEPEPTAEPTVESMAVADLEDLVAGSVTPDDEGAEVSAECAGGIDVEVDAAQDCHLTVGEQIADVHVVVTEVDDGEIVGRRHHAVPAGGPGRRDDPVVAGGAGLHGRLGRLRGRAGRREGRDDGLHRDGRHGRR